MIGAISSLPAAFADKNYDKTVLPKF